jgi:RHS repeat-associated protein
LQEIKNLTPKNALISQFDYTYDQEGEILTWTKNYSGLNPAPQRFDLSYDNADQLIAAPLKNASTNALINEYTYGYDFTSNRTSEQVGTITTSSMPNIVNELTNQSGGTNRTLTHDPNGNLVNDGSKRAFEWDAANRLAAVNYTGTTNRTELSYDGLGRMSKIVEKAGTKVQSTQKFVWCGMERCEYRDANDAITLRVYPQGQYKGTTPYYFTRDHLGSIREMLKSDGTVGGRYDYDPYGRSTTVKTIVPDFNFTGFYRHSKSNLDFAVYRAYDPDLGRWLSRDPLKEAESREGVNLYEYAGNDPWDGVDPLGLWKAYGNWCGPNWTGGRQEFFNRHRLGFYSPPIDGLDAACVKHDICYYKCRRTNPCNPDDRSSCFRDCDHRLTSAAYAVGGFWGNVIGTAIDRPGKRGADENDPSCSCDKK